MYIPTAHKIEDPVLIVQMMRENPFATFVLTDSGTPVATHLPVLVEEDEPIRLSGHMARQNRHWKLWEAGSDSLMIFAGPHGYVSPAWYVSSPNVPTWNYVSIHAYGRVEILEDREACLAHLRQMMDVFDPALAETRPESASRKYLLKLLPGIVAFRMTVDRIEAKAKLNQNKSEPDRLAVRERYLTSEIGDERRMAALMRPEN